MLDLPIRQTASKSSRLRRLISSPSLSFLMEAHNGLSARIAEEAGFEALWASGLSISASLGVRDNNEATWTQVLEILEFMADATTIPILVDGDTGYGDFNTMRRLVRKLETRDVAGVCIEDKCFPKTNSFLNGTSQSLAQIEEFCGKIKAGRDAQTKEDFVIVARVEAFIAGWGLEEALKRAEAYVEAGADAILMHSASRQPTEVFSFLEAWKNRAPVVLVPTKYFTTPTDAFRERQVSALIWANHNLRASITSMQKISRTIFRDQGLEGVEEGIAPLAEVFRLQGAEELAEAERRYLPEVAANAKAVMLAFTRGEEMGPLTADRPKAMVKVDGKPVLSHMTEAMRSAGVRDLNVVRGYCPQAVDVPNVRMFDSPTTERLAEVLALSSAREVLEGDVIVCYGDVLFKKFLVTQLLDSEADFTVMVDTEWKTSRNRNRYADYAICSREASRSGFHDQILLNALIHDANDDSIHGEWMGFLRLSPRGSTILRGILDELCEQEPEEIEHLDMAALINLLVERGHDVHVLYTAGNWLDCDSVADAIDGGSFGK